MAKLWDGAEFFRMMVANEKAVGDWYRRLAEDAAIGGKFFENMAKDEDRYMKIYSALLERYEASGKFKVEVSDDHQEYLNVLLKDIVEHDNAKMLAKISKVKTKDDVFELAESLERDSVMMVNEIMDLYPDIAPDDMKIVLNEEKKHLQMVLTSRMQSQLTNLKM
jgi:hypothetical protein